MWTLSTSDVSAGRLHPRMRRRQASLGELHVTDVAQHPEFAARKRTTEVDGEEQTGWFSGDFTLAEIKTLGAISTDAQRPQEFNGKFKVVAFDEVIALAKQKSQETGR